MLSVLYCPVGYQCLPCVVVGAIYFAAAFAAGHLGSQFIVLFPCPIIGRIFCACRIKEILIIVENIPVVSVRKSIGFSVVHKLLCRSLVDRHIKIIFCNKIINRHELLFVRHLKHGTHILYPDYVGVRLCRGKADSQGIVVLVR